MAERLAAALARGRQLRAVGFDDGPFGRAPGSAVPVVGVVCSDVRFEGMVCGRVARDGEDATEVLARLLVGGKFLPQLHLVLLDGIALGGFNVVDLPGLAQALGRPCVAVMRRAPDLDAVRRALGGLPGGAGRLERLGRAGPVCVQGGFTFQVAGAPAELVAGALARVTDRGRVPEPLRLAHLVGAAWVTGQSGRRA
jgi:endonuclease V-like protein UPF0215 family